MSATLATARECQWTAASEASWIQLSPNAGQGEASVTLIVAENPIASRRSSAILINDARVNVAQDPAPCRYQLNGSSAQMGAEGGPLAIGVSAVAGVAGPRRAKSHGFALWAGRGPAMALWRGSLR